MSYFYRVLSGLILAGWAFTIGSVVTKSDGGLPALSAAIVLTMAVAFLAGLEHREQHR